MEPLRVKTQVTAGNEMESWDDEDFVIDGEELTLRSASTATAPSRRRDSASSHLSMRSDLDSWHGEVEENVHVPGNDEKSTQEAIRAAELAGIPLPRNVPSSALMGGIVKRLSGRKPKAIIHDDWENDLELPDGAQGLNIVQKSPLEFPETLRQVSDSASPASPEFPIMDDSTAISSKAQGFTPSGTNTVLATVNLHKFQENDDNDDFFGDGCETIKVSKTRPSVEPVPLVTPPTPQKRVEPKEPEDDFENGLELPSDGKLRLSARKDIPKTPSSNADDLDWGEGSLGTRCGGTRRDVRSNRSSSVSALSPSLSSSFTFESEDETFEGLVLPEGPVNFQDRLQKRRTSRSPQRDTTDESEPPLKKVASAASDRGDFMEGLEIGDGEVFSSKKLTLHRNVKVKETQPRSPNRPKTSVSLTFTSKPLNSTRIPRLNHERTHSTALEPVSESGGPIVQSSRRTQSRLGHLSQQAASGMASPSTPSSTSSSQPGTPLRRELGSKASVPSMRDPTTTTNQLLKQKRSLPGIKLYDSPPRPSSFRVDRPPSRGGTKRPPSSFRPKTPVERSRPSMTESPAAQARRTHVPFLPAGVSASQSQNVATKTLRHFRRHDSDNSIDMRPRSRALSRTGLRSPSPQRYKVAADTWERLSRPKSKKKFGDGHELDGFDDLPTSRETETKYMKQPIGTGPRPNTRQKGHQATNSMSDRTMTPVPNTLQSPARTFQVPRFARDTAASRIAREISLAQRPPSSGPLAPVTSQRVAQLSSRNNVTPQPHHPFPTLRPRRSVKRPPQLKPHLIANLNGGKEFKSLNGMFYNPETYRWEGNENALNAFEPPLLSPEATVIQPHLSKENPFVTPRPALITNISATKGIQVVGGMVFDPQNMCWLKIDTPANSKFEGSDTGDVFDALAEEEDVFKDIPDLDDKAGADEGGHSRLSDIKDDWLVGEEFDVGPEFIRRQREEEERWRKKCEKWVGRGMRDRETWRWTIRDLVSQFDDLQCE